MKRISDCFQNARQEITEQFGSENSRQRACDSFMHALAENNPDTACALLAFNPFIANSSLTKAGFSPLHWLCSSETLLPALRLYLALRDKILTNEIQDPLEWAVKNNNPKAASLLIELGATLQPFHLQYSCESLSFESIKLCLSAGLDPFVKIAPATLAPFEIVQSKLSNCYQSQNPFIKSQIFAILSLFESVEISRAIHNYHFLPNHQASFSL